MGQVSNCPICGSVPIKETKIEMLGSIKDDGYSVTLGRFKCPDCGFTTSWGKSYSVYCGWDKAVEVWEDAVKNDHS